MDRSLRFWLVDLDALLSGAFNRESNTKAGAIARLLQRKQTHFVLWRVKPGDSPPVLVIGQLQPGTSILADERRLSMQVSHKADDVWEINASDCALVDGQVYHYWFEVTDTNPYMNLNSRILCTDPIAWTVDYRLLAPLLPAPYSALNQAPAAVVKYSDGQLLPCDPGGETADWVGDARPDTLPPNDRVVIYKLPTTWARIGQSGEQIATCTFRDVAALIESRNVLKDYAGLAVQQKGRAHLQELGVNVLELANPADSCFDRDMGSGSATTNHFAADHNLGFSKGHPSPTASTDLVNLIKSCHQNGLRYILDVTMYAAFRNPYVSINYSDFFVNPNVSDPDAYFEGERRKAFGGNLFRYNLWVTGYDPVTGEFTSIVPARQYIKACINHWMRYYHVDGLRIVGSTKNIGSLDFVRDVKNYAYDVWIRRGGPRDRFLVIGTEFGAPQTLLAQNRIDSLSNEAFKSMVRSAIVGQPDVNEPSFEWTVRKLVDCRLLGFGRGSAAINYVTSEYVAGFRNERLYNFLQNHGIAEPERRIKLAFVCLLTAVGLPMILAGEEFADEQIAQRTPGGNVFAAVNFNRLTDSWRKRLFEYVARLVQLRTSSNALSVDDTAFIHIDITGDRRILAWQRGRGSEIVVVVANFSDWITPDAHTSDAQYIIPNWPVTPIGYKWHEVTQARDIPQNYVGREPVFPWEAKVYALKKV